MTLEDRVQVQRLHVCRRAEELREAREELQRASGFLRERPSYACRQAENL
jgi:hypothetical protein